MPEVNSVHYLHDASGSLELILCDHSTISYPLHNHISVFTFGLVLEGAVTLHTEQAIIHYHQNQTFLIPPYAPHSLRSSVPYSLLSLCIHKNLQDFSPDSLAKALANLLTGLPDSAHLAVDPLPHLLSSFYSFADIFQAPIPPINDPLIDRIKSQLETFPESKLSLEEMAHTALVSKYYFIRRFKQLVGLTPHQFQIQNRIRKAQRLLGNAANITEVALTTGFCDQSHFIKQFEKLVGLTPSAYKLSAATQQSAGTNLANR